MKGKNARIIYIIAAAFAVLFAAGPRINMDIKTPPVNVPSDITRIDAFLRETESRYADIIPNTEKTVLWHNGKVQKTHFSVIYIHGFSATRQETAPLADIVANRLRANLFYTRLKGHGRNGEALAEATVADWIYDMKEAYEIGKLIGDNVIIIGMSNGGTIAAWFAVQEPQPETAALILISPNFGPKDKAAELLAWPWAKYYIPLIAGPKRSFEPINEKHALYWTSEYPIEALFPMMGTIILARKAPLKNLDLPVQVLYAPKDQVLDSRLIEKAYKRIGSDKKELVPITEGDFDEMHIFAGDALSPSTTGDVAKKIISFLQSVGGIE